MEPQELKKQSQESKHLSLQWEKQRKHSAPNKEFPKGQQITFGGKDKRGRKSTSTV